MIKLVQKYFYLESFYEFDEGIQIIDVANFEFRFSDF